MELKDVILSTLAEMDEEPEAPAANKKSADNNSNTDRSSAMHKDAQLDTGVTNDEQLWLESVRERLLVLFEGFQSPQNVQIEAKIDLSLNFLEYLLANIDTRLERLKGEKNHGDL